MSRIRINSFFNMDDRETKRKLIVQLGSLHGLYDFRINPRRNTRSVQANRYLWGCVYEAVRLGIAEAWGEDLTADECHIAMREKFLSKPIVNRSTGEVVATTCRSTADLDTAEFSHYIDEIIKFAGEYLNVSVPSPDDYAPPIPAGQPAHKPEDM